MIFKNIIHSFLLKWQLLKKNNENKQTEYFFSCEAELELIKIFYYNYISYINIGLSATIERKALRRRQDTKNKRLSFSRQSNEGQDKAKCEQDLGRLGECSLRWKEICRKF